MRTNRYVLGILAHVDSGKTTLAESILYKSGIIRKIGRVDHKDTFLDHYDVERTRGITVFSKQAQFCVGEKEICLLDTPGHVDFSTEMERTLQVLDYAPVHHQQCRWCTGAYNDTVAFIEEASYSGVFVHQ